MEQPADGRDARSRRHDHCRRTLHDARPKALSEPRSGRALVGVWQLPRRNVKKAHDKGQSRRQWHRTAGGVVHRAGSPSVMRAPAGRDGRRSEQKRLDRERAGSQELRRRQPAPADDVEAGQPLDRLRRVGQAGLQDERERFTRQRLGRERAQKLLEVGGRDGAAIRFLEGAQVEDDVHPGRRRDCVSRRIAESDRVPFVGSAAQGRRLRNRSRSSSPRNCTTTTSASATIRRDILDWPTRRSRNVIGTSMTRAPARLARYVISIWKTYPPAWMPSNGMAPRVEARHALKPPVRSWGRSPRTVRAKRLPPRETTRRPRPQSTTPPPRRVPRADDEVGAVLARRRHERWQRRRVVRPVGVHLHDDRRSACERHTEAVEVRPTETLLGGSMSDAHVIVRGSECVRDLPRAVGRAVVHDEQRGPGQRLSDRCADRGQVLRLVVRGQHNPDAPIGTGVGHCAITIVESMRSCNRRSPAPGGGAEARSTVAEGSRGVPGGAGELGARRRGGAKISGA